MEREADAEDFHEAVMVAEVVCDNQAILAILVIKTVANIGHSIS